MISEKRRKQYREGQAKWLTKPANRELARQAQNRWRAKHAESYRTYRRLWARKDRMLQRLWECLLWFPVEVEG